MLIEFKVKNFRSIRDEQTLSLVATKANKELPDCIIDKPLKGMANLKYLKGAAIYGANASGKTNVMQALRFLSILYAVLQQKFSRAIRRKSSHSS